VAQISLSNGGVALVDDADHALVSRWKWRLAPNGYARRSTYRGCMLMHRLVYGDVPAGLEVDHINRNKLDNRRANLRAVTHNVNQRNAPGGRNNTSGYKGVSYDKARGKWRAATKHNGRHILIGRYSTPQEASAAYLAWQSAIVPQIAEVIGRAVIANAEA
jgi:hypothetical protein